MAEEFENLELRDENTGETETFTPVDTTARQQIEELNETLTEWNTYTSGQLIINDNIEGNITSMLGKVGNIAFVFISITGTTSSESTIATLPDGFIPKRNCRLYCSVYRNNVYNAYFAHASADGTLRQSYTSNEWNAVIICGAYPLV